MTCGRNWRRTYRRLAAEAAARGDHRRAAYLHGVLLRDLRAAVNALLAGGLYRDAALLLRDRLNDPKAAADAFERAGDHDEALRLYDRHHEYERAAELLRRLGEEERAVEYFGRAADTLAAGGHFRAAGDLMHTKAYRTAAAVAHYRAGWARVSDADAVTCAERLLEVYAVADDPPAFDALLTEAEVVLADRPRDVGRLFNNALREDRGFLSEDARADLTDRVRLLFAAHLRANAAIGAARELADELFPVARPWSPPVGRDAKFAVWNRPERVSREAPPAPLVRLVAGPVTAVTAVRGTFDVVVAGADCVVCWRVADGRIQPVATPYGERVAALSASAHGDVVYAVLHGGDGKWRLRCYATDRADAFRPTTQCVLATGDDAAPEVYLQPTVTFRDGKHRVVVATPVECHTFAGPYLQPEPADDPPTIYDQRVLLRVDASDGRTWWWAGDCVYWGAPGGGPVASGWDAPWTPGGPVDCLAYRPGVMQVAGVDNAGCVRWADFDIRAPEQIHICVATVSRRTATRPPVCSRRASLPRPRAGTRYTGSASQAAGCR